MRPFLFGFAAVALCMWSLTVVQDVSTTVLGLACGLVGFLLVRKHGE